MSPKLLRNLNCVVYHRQVSSGAVAAAEEVGPVMPLAVGERQTSVSNSLVEGTLVD